MAVRSDDMIEAYLFKCGILWLSQLYFPEPKFHQQLIEEMSWGSHRDIYEQRRTHIGLVLDAMIKLEYSE